LLIRQFLASLNASQVRRSQSVVALPLGYMDSLTAVERFSQPRSPKLQFFAAMFHNQRDPVRSQWMLHVPVLGSTQGVVVLFAHLSLLAVCSVSCTVPGF